MRWVVYVMFTLSFGAAFLNVYLREEITKYAYRLHETNRERIALENDIHKLKVRLEELRSPERINAIAEQLGMELLRQDSIEITVEE